MSIQQKIINALSGICANIEQDNYEGNTPFIVYEIRSESGQLFSDDAPQFDNYYIVINYVIEKNVNYISKKKDIKNALIAAGFEYPNIYISFDAEINLRTLNFTTYYLEESEA